LPARRRMRSGKCDSKVLTLENPSTCGRASNGPSQATFQLLQTLHQHAARIWIVIKGSEMMFL
jgi:hypothetical protein